jgi:fructokinase
MATLLAGLARRGLLGADRRGDLRTLSTDVVAGLVDDAIRASAITCSRRGADPPRAAELGGAFADA